jgi:hypothetical protein
VGPARQPHGPNNGVVVPTAFGPRLPPCPPMASWATPVRRPAHRFRRSQPPPRAALKRTPPRGAPLSSSTHCRHYIVVPLSLSHCETPPRSPSELPVTALSSAPTSGAPRTSLLMPSAAPLLHHRRSSLAKLSHRRQHAPALLRPSQPHPKHRSTKYILPNHSDPTGDPYSGLPPSLPHRRPASPPRAHHDEPLCCICPKLEPSPLGLAPWHLLPQPLAAGWSDSADEPRAGEEWGELPCFIPGRKAQVGQATFTGWAKRHRGHNPLQQYPYPFILQIIQINFQIYFKLLKFIGNWIDSIK